MAHNQESTKLHVELVELNIKWADLQDTVNSTDEHGSASMERISNLEYILHSKTDEVVEPEDKRAKMEERL